MCGIAGILRKSDKFSPDQAASFVQQMTDLFEYRGPDHGDIWTSPDGACILGHRRLSIIDTSDVAHQPMKSQNGSSAITYNGELYNYKLLKQELLRKKISFVSDSDTEVILYALKHWAEAAFDKMDAMFGLAYYDCETQCLTLARDRFGEKPLFYCETPDYFAFASELHALTTLPDFDNRIDARRISLYLAFQYLPAPYSIYCGASKLLPGHMLIKKQNMPNQVTPYFSFKTSTQKSSPISLDEKAEELEEILVESLERRLMSDVPIGAFLSGGIDSSTVVALAAKRLNRQLKTFSIGFQNSDYSEHQVAAQTADELGLEFEHRQLEQDWTLKAPKIAAMLDEPNGDSSCFPTYMLSALAKEQVTVALSGDGGDEIFGGYDRYFIALEDEQKMLAGDELILGRGMGRQYYYHGVIMFPDHHLEALMGQIPADSLNFVEMLRREVDNAYVKQQKPLGNILRQMDAENYLPGAVLAKVDRMSMQHSLEVRTPFLGKEVAEFAASLAQTHCFESAAHLEPSSPARYAYHGKIILKKILEKYLPKSILHLPKKGFNIPGEDWPSEQLIKQLDELIHDGNCQLLSWISPPLLQQYISRMRQQPNPYQIWTVILIESWLRIHPWRPA